jgi:hypothetical protein
VPASTRPDGRRPYEHPRRRAGGRPRSAVHGPPSTVPDDAAIRRQLAGELAALYPQARIRHEMLIGPVELGMRRVDVAVVGPGELAGWEIKSDRDSLRRLAGQAAVYGAVLDRVTLVAGPRHLGHAAAVLPGWWGLTLTGPAGGAVTLTPVRPAGPNPAVDPAALVRLLWREEARSLLWMRGTVRGTSRLRLADLHTAVAAAYPVLDDLRAGVRRMLRARPESWTWTATSTAGTS